MLVENIGNYVNRATGEVYQVERRTKQGAYPLQSGASRPYKGAIDYITSCGIDLSPKSDDESVFEIIDIDVNGIIHRQR